MGLFKHVVNVSNPTLAIASKTLTGKSLGSHAEKALCMDGGGDSPYQFNPDLTQLLGDIDVVRQTRDRDITGPRKSTEVALKQLESDKVRSLGDIEAGTTGRYAAMADAIARQGGLESGAGERLAMSLGRDTTLAKQKTAADFSRLSSDLTAQDFASQEALKDKALFTTPQYSAIPANIQVQAAAANMQARALHDAQKKGQLASLGSLAGMGIGAAFGGPTGAMIGGSAGGLFAQGLTG